LLGDGRAATDQLAPALVALVGALDGFQVHAVVLVEIGVFGRHHSTLQIV
jgi:hypothetical protein